MKIKSLWKSVHSFGRYTRFLSLDSSHDLALGEFCLFHDSLQFKIKDFLYFPTAELWGRLHPHINHYIFGIFEIRQLGKNKVTGRTGPGVVRTILAGQLKKEFLGFRPNRMGRLATDPTARFRLFLSLYEGNRPQINGY